MIHIRAFQPEDEAAIIDLWEQCGLTRPWNDPHQDILRKLPVQAEWFLVGVTDDQIVATVMAGYDGHRGSVYYLAVHPELQGKGIGRAMMTEVEDRLRAAGCPKLNLLVRSDNDTVIEFYRRLGYTQDAVVSLGKRLISDTPQLSRATDHAFHCEDLSTDLPEKNAMSDQFLTAAIEEAQRGLAAGGIPIGSVLVIDGAIVGRGHNQRVQKGSAVRHAEMDCLENAGRLEPADYRRATLYSTLSPCDMCSGAVLLYKIPTVIVGENRTFRGPEEYVRSRGVEVRVVDDERCVAMMEHFIREHPELWNEDIGEMPRG